MTKQKVFLPLECEAHLHVGYGPHSGTPCPWCEIEQLKKDLAAAQFLLNNPQIKTRAPDEPAAPRCDDRAFGLQCELSKGHDGPHRSEPVNRPPEPSAQRRQDLEWDRQREQIATGLQKNREAPHE